MRSIHYLVVHCSATIEGKDFDAKDIDAWHKKRGWSGIGYHYVIKLDGAIEKGRPDCNFNKLCCFLCQFSGVALAICSA